MHVIPIHRPTTIAFSGKQTLSPYVATYDPDNYAIEAQLRAFLLKAFVQDRKLKDQIKDIQFLQTTGIATFQCTPKILKALNSFKGFQSIEPDTPMYTQ